MLVRHVLLELNIINVPDVERYAKQVATRVGDEKARAWLVAGLRRWLINHQDTAIRVTNLTKNAPTWMADRIRDGVALYRFESKPDLTSRLNHVADWLNSLAAHAAMAPQTHPKREELRREASVSLSRLDRVGIDAAFERADRWFAAINKIDKEDEDEPDPSNVVPIMDGVRGKWVELLSQTALGREGRMMGHCVGGGGYAVGKGTRNHIYSLRDARNVPHVTIQVERGKVKQVKGRGNRAPVAKYAADVVLFLNHLNLPCDDMGEHDIKKLGVLQDKDGRYGTLYDLAEKITDLPGGGEVIKHDRVYHLWKNGSFASWQMSEYYSDSLPQISSVEIPEGEDKDLRRKVQTALIAYWNSLNPVPRPGYLGNGFELRYGGNPPRWGFLEDLQETADIDGLQVRTLTDEYGDTKYYIAVPEAEIEENRTILLSKNKGRGKNNELDYFKVELPYHQAGKQFVAPIIAEFLNKIRWEGNVSENESIKLYKQGGEWFAGFDPERLGYEDVVPNVFYAKPNAPKLYDSSGDPVLDANSIHSGISWNIDKGVRHALSKYSSAIAAFLNSRLPTGVKGMFKAAVRNSKSAKEELASVGLIYDPKKKAFKTAMDADAKAVFRFETVAAYLVGNLMDVRNKDGITVATFKQDASSRNMFVFQAFNDAASREDRRNALLGAAQWEAAKEGRTVYGYHNTNLAMLDLLSVPNEKPSLVRLSQRFPKRTVLEFEDGYQWIDTAYTPMDRLCAVTDHASNKSSLANDPKGHRYVLRGADNIDVMRVLANNDKGGRGSIYQIWIKEGQHAELATQETLQRFLDKLQALITKELLPVRNSYFAPKFHLVQTSDGNLSPLASHQRYAQYVDGKIGYEDGHKWVRKLEYKGEYWYLMGPNVNTEYAAEVAVLMKSGRIASMELKQRAHHKPKHYMAYLNDLVDIVHDINENPLKRDDED